MSKCVFKVIVSPLEALHIVKTQQDADLIHEEIHDLGDKKYIGTLVFEKYFMRVGNRAALVVTSDNLNGETEVRAIATGSSEGFFFKFDWGAADDFASSVKEILEDYIIK